MNSATLTTHSRVEIACLEYPQYTRPREFLRGTLCRKILLSGNHEAIAAWRKEKSLEKTANRRSDLLN